MFYEDLARNFEPTCGRASSATRCRSFRSHADQGRARAGPSDPLLRHGPVVNRGLLEDSPALTRARNSATVFLDHPNRPFLSKQGSVARTTARVTAGFSATTRHLWSRRALASTCSRHETKTSRQCRHSFDLWGSPAIGIRHSKQRADRENIGARDDSLKCRLERFSRMWERALLLTRRLAAHNGAITYQNQFRSGRQKLERLGAGRLRQNAPRVAERPVEVQTGGPELGAVFRTCPATDHHSQHQHRCRRTGPFRSAPAGTSACRANAITR